jgi:hypothetical protein
MFIADSVAGTRAKRKTIVSYWLNVLEGSNVLLMISEEEEEKKRPRS